MTSNPIEIPSAVADAFDSFTLDSSLIALILTLDGNTLHAHPSIRSKGPESPFQSNLSLLDDVLDSKTSLYILLRRGSSIYAITFVPYRAPEDEREKYLRYRHDLVQLLGGEHFEMSLICKEIGEITDARSWVERDAHRQGNRPEKCTDACEDAHDQSFDPKDAGYKKNECRLCDRRMKNKITDEVLGALGKLENEGDCVQIETYLHLIIIQSLDADLSLALDLQTSSLPPEQVSSHLPTAHPTFTFYRHPNKLLYFVFHSPDSATVQQRMKHTMAIPGLVNVHAGDCGVHVDQKIEIHEPEDLVFEQGDDKVGKFRSMYLRGGWQGTESQYEGLDRDKKFYDAVK
ncbi:actin monomer binding protein-like protein [Boeremia exigua]|uniref:actin monomer binding protein-like protein n=1 Tax=Boeremia exigua TaxID=749465 RepID=UPI001E8E494E|nr:actin monomer binding protein-like protein [Boeremia exigua]KAH6625659.1 actin monomer binding protein-like protein [Boeremia exigua]